MDILGWEESESVFKKSMQHEIKLESPGLI